MRVLLPLLALFLLGQAAPPSVMLEDAEPQKIMSAESEEQLEHPGFELEDSEERLNEVDEDDEDEEFDDEDDLSEEGESEESGEDTQMEARKHGSYLRNLVECERKPKIIVQQVSGECGFNKKGLITAPEGTKECTLRIISDAPGMMNFMPKKYPADAELSLEDAVQGSYKFITEGKGYKKFSGRASTTFKYTSNGGGALRVKTSAYCYQGCHETVQVNSGQIYDFILPGSDIVRRANERFKLSCEFWLIATAGTKLKFTVSETKQGLGSDCSKGKVVFDKSGNKFFSSEYTATPDQLPFEITSNENEMDIVLMPGEKRSGMIVGQYRVVENEGKDG